MKKSRFLIVSIALILSVLMVASVCIFASADQTAKLTVDASGGKVKVLVNDELKSHGTSTAALKVAIGSKVTLVVEDNTEGFLFWTDSALNTCGNGAATYTFTMTGDASYTAWFKSADGTLVVYRNTNDSKQVLASAEYSSSAEFKAHLVDSAIKFGYTFSKWNMTEAEIVAAIDAKTPVVEVAPVYTDKVASYTIKVNNGAIQEASATTGSYAYGTEITLVAGTAPTGYSFSAWKNSAGKVISTSSTLKVKVFTNETFSAVYTEAPVTYPASAELSITSDKANKTLVSTASFFIPEGNVTEYGLIYSKNVKCDATSLMLGNVDGQGIKKASYKGYTNVLANHFSGVDSVSARAYIIYTDGSGVKHTLYSDVVYAEYDDTILKLNVANDGTVTNASANSSVLSEYSFSGYGTKSITKDKELNKNVISFVGNYYYPSVYNFLCEEYYSDFKDGFSYEVLFKPTAAISSGYVGVLDLEEGGGFGLNLYPGSNSNTVKISVDFYAPSWKAYYQSDIDLNQWCHVVFSYSQSEHKLFVYVNGDLAYETALTSEMTLPDFSGRGAGTAYVCIGGCAQKWTTDKGGASQGMSGFTGDIAVCNIFSNPITDESKVAVMCAKAKTPASDVSSDAGSTVAPPTQSEQEIIAELLNLKHELRVDANGDFKIVVFSDFQCSTISVNDTKVHTDAKYPNYGKTYGETLVESMNNIKLIVDREDPDLVLFAGDNSWNIRSEADMRTAVSNMVSYVESKGIPWAHVFGNHDDEHTTRHSDILTKEEQHKIYMEFEYCVAKDVLYGYNGEELFGVGNYVLPVLTNDGSKIAFNIWALDSGQYDHEFNEATDNIVFDGNGFYGHYQSMEKNQVDWYYETSKLLEKYNGGETIPAMLYQHIPLQESYFAYKYGTNKTGVKGENISAHPQNVGLFAAIVERGDVQLIAHGHDHKNDFTADYKGVTFAYTASIGTEEYYDASMLGGRVVTFSTKTGKVETEMSYINARDAGGDILELKINDDNSVSNAVSGRPVLNSYTGTSGTKSVTTDATLNRKFIHFTGGKDNNQPSTYWMSTSDVAESLFSDGFAVEALFRVTGESTDYLGIIDYAEGGGFDLNYQKIDGVNTLFFELGHGTTGYAKATAPIEINVWNHVLVTFDYSTLKLTMYINGVQVDQKSVTTGYRAPESFWGTPGAYMCIGGCAQSDCYGARGFIGDIAIANVYVNSKTSEEAIMAYNSVKASSFKNDGTMLKLNITDDAVTNASATGPLLLKYNSTNNTTTVGTDAVLNRKVITFNGGTYRLYPETLEADFANGFAYEVLFKATSSETYESNTKYAGVLDFDESNGGFGLRYIRKDENTITLQFTFATSDSDTIKNVAIGDVSVGEWCHVVFSFDGTNINVWVNGTNVYSQAAGGSFRTASFAKGCGFIAIGAAAWDDSKTAGRDYGIYGLRGSIAICNIYSDGVNATKAAELYAATGLK